MNAESTTSDVLEGVDLTGKTALVTGASSGLGAETVRALQSAGCDVVGAVRDIVKASGVVACDLIPLDLADLVSVRAAAEQIADRLPRLDLLINNAGVMATPLMRTAQGFEMQLGTNHLGHFALTNALVPTLSSGSRVVNVSSRAHLSSPIRWEDPHFRDEAAYRKWIAYGQSKTANILFTVELERRLAGQGIHSYSLHPGIIRTALSRHLTAEDNTRMATRLPRTAMSMKTVSQGAATTVYAATAKDLEGRGGYYLEDCRIADVTPGDGSAGYAPWAMDPDQAARLWTWSQQQTEA